MISILFAVFTQLQFFKEAVSESAFDLLQKNKIVLFHHFMVLYANWWALKKEGDSFKFYKESKSLKNTRFEESYFDAAQYLGNKSHGWNQRIL